MSHSPVNSVPEQYRSLFLGDLSCFCNESDLYNAFHIFGEITSIRLMKSKETQKCLGYGFITFADYQATLAAKELDGTLFLGRKMK
jgi:RNA recognition motif-containing protein